MTPRFQIPILGLLGLTGCDSESGSITGRWTAVEVDGEAYPAPSDGPDAAALKGFAMIIDADLTGEFTYYGTYEYEDIGVRGTISEPLMVDDVAGSDVQISLAGLIFERGYVEGGEDEDIPADARLAQDDALERAAAARPIPAGSGVVLDCRRSGDRLDCDASGLEGVPKKWRFARESDEK